MKKHFALILIPVALVVFALAFSFLFAAAPVHASGQAVGTFLQTTPLPTISVNVTAVVPNTGNPPQRTTIFFSSWLVWLVLGIAVIVGIQSVSAVSEKAVKVSLDNLGANILEVDHRRLFLDVPAKGTKLDVTIETRDAAHAEDIMKALADDGYQPARIEPGATME